jgi:bacillopeptidase F
MPRLSVSRDGGKLAYSSNYGLQQILGYPTEYSDAYLIDMTVASPDTIGTASGGSTGGGGSTTTTRIEETNASITYKGPWSSSTSSAFSGRSAVKSANKNARATFTFTGVGANWIGYEDAASGIAQIYVDGVLKGTVDCYAATPIAQPKLYSVTDLANAQHTLAVTVTGTRNAKSNGTSVWIDAFEYTH